MESIERLEQFWYNLVLDFFGGTDMNGAVRVCYPEIPIHQFNNIADINVYEDEVENLLKRATGYFRSKGFPYVWFRVSPITRPRTFRSFLENHGFEKKTEESVMVFKGKHVEDKLSPKVKVKEISESEIELWNRIASLSFEMPIEWKGGLDRFDLEVMRRGARLYLAYVERKPVGTSGLLSLEKTGGIFFVGTLVEYRRRGIGTTLTAQAVVDSIKEGNNLHTLQTTKGGNAERLYREIGFETNYTIHWFSKKI